MLHLAFSFILVAAALGSVLAILFLQPGGALPPAMRVLAPRARALGLVHGALGAAGFLILVAGLRSGAIRPVTGAAGFGGVSAWLLGAALLLGLLVLAVARRVRSRASLLIGVHATLAISGGVVLLALVLLA